MPNDDTLANQQADPCYVPDPAPLRRQVGAYSPNLQDKGLHRTRDPWRHRSAGMTCASCMWNVAKTTARPVSQSDPLGEPQGVLGRCRRHAPTMNGYPVVFSVDWCGDHKLDENKT